MSAYRPVRFGIVVCLGLSLAVALARANGDVPPPAIAPAAVISPDAQKTLDELDAAYGRLTSLDLAGTVGEKIDAGGRAQSSSSTFTSSFLTPNFFRHEVQGNLLCGSTGKQAYALLTTKNIYTSADAPSSRVADAQMPKPLGELLDPSLRFATSARPSADLLAGASAVSMAPDTDIDGAAFSTLVVDSKGKTLTLLLDSQTHLVRRATTDVSELLRSQGIGDVKSATVTVDYTRSTIGAAIAPEQFAWKAPQGARDVTARHSAEDADSGEPAEKLAGQPAPDFKLAGLDGKQVSLADLKGSVAILDFWATWCGPCRASLPHLDEVYAKFKSDGLKVYAVNLQEEKDAVQKFVDDTKLTVPVLLDSDGKTATSYRASAIPETVLIGKDGKIRKVFIGFSSTTEDELRSAVEDALKN